MVIGDEWELKPFNIRNPGLENCQEKAEQEDR